MATTTSSSTVTVCGRGFSDRELDAIRAIIADETGPCRAEIARRTCREIGWVDASGRLKAMSCRVALLRLEEQGHITLPEPRNGNGNGERYRPSRTLEAPREPVVGSAGGIEGLRLHPVSTRSESRLWNEAIARFHYLGYTPLTGAQQRYLVRSDQGLLGAIGFGASAWRVKPRDAWIGWDSDQRRSGLHRIVNNARFLLLPWVRVRNLASRVLALAASRIVSDWRDRYGFEPVLLETFVERTRFTGACYRASNWIHVGDTQGRGKLDRHRLRALPVKHVFVLPLTRPWRAVLCG